MMKIVDTAKLLVQYYHVYDDMENPNYYQDLDKVTRLCLSSFGITCSGTIASTTDDPLISLFLTFQSLRESAFALDALNLDLLASELDSILQASDTNLRVAVSRVTGESLAREIDQSLVSKDYLSLVDHLIAEEFAGQVIRIRKKIR